MRTKHLLTAIVLPSLFAACTADELVKTDNGAAEDLSKRPVVEGVTLNLGGADTKAIVPEGGNFNTIQYESTDKIGALLVDKLSGATTDPIANYTLLQKNFNSNYQFNNVGGASFASEAYLVEGNYVFYFPYSGQRTRGQLNTNLPITQKLAKDANGNWSTFPDVLAKSIEAGAPLALGYDFIKSTDANKNANVTLKQIYAVPAITVKNAHTVKNDKGEDVSAPVKIQEIVLTYDNGFVVKAPLKFSDAGDKTAWGVAAKSNESNSVVKVLFNEDIPSSKVNTHAKGVWTEATISNANGKARYTSDVTGDAVAGGKSTTITVTLDEPVEVAAEADFTFYAVIPAAAYAANALKVTVIDNEGLSCTPISLGKASLYQGKRYPVEEYTAGVVNQDVAGTTLSGYMGGFSTGSGVRVSTVDELLSAIKNFKVVDGDYECKIRLAGEAVINQRVAQFLNALSSSITKATSITFVNEATISGAAALTLAPTMNVKFSEGVTVKAGSNATINNNKVILPNEKTMTIEEGATVTMGTNGFASGSEIENAGTLNVKAEVASAVYNYGVMNATDNGSVASLENGDDYYMNVAATLNVTADKTLTINGESINAVGATINNWGTLTASQLTNNGTIVNGGEENNAAVATISGNASVAYQAKATIDNYGTLTVGTNNAVINMASVNGVATVNGGTATGVVNNDVLASVTGTNENLVKYTMTGNQTSIPEYLQANGINTLVLKGAVLNLSKGLSDDYTSNVGALDVVVEGNTTISGTTGAGTSKQVLKMTAGKTLTVSAGAKLTIMASAKLTAEGNGFNIDVKNTGKVINNGEVTNVSNYQGAGTTPWTGNDWEMHSVNVNSGNITVSANGVYTVGADGLSVESVAAVGHLKAASDMTVKMTAAVYNGISTGKLYVADNVTLQIGEGNNTEDLLEIETPVEGVTDASDLISNFDEKKDKVFAALKTMCDPSAANAKVVATTGTLKAVFKFTVGSDARYVIATWTGTGWTFASDDVQNTLN